MGTPSLSAPAYGLGGGIIGERRIDAESRTTADLDLLAPLAPTAPMRRSIFVFSSNLAGRHGKGAALTAVRQYGAKYGQAFGMQGDSYGIPTKDANLRSLPLENIRLWVERFLNFAQSRPEFDFRVTAIGCGLAGYSPAQIAPMFREVLLRGWTHIQLPAEFMVVLHGQG